MPQILGGLTGLERAKHIGRGVIAAVVVVGVAVDTHRSSLSLLTRQPRRGPRARGAAWSGRAASAPSRSRSAVQHSGDLAVAESAEVRELDHLRCSAGSSTSAPRTCWASVFALQAWAVSAVVGGQALCRDVVMDVETGLGGLAPKRIERSVAHGGEHPGADAAARRVEARAAAPERENASWTMSSASVRSPTDPVREREGDAAVAVEEDLERDDRRPGGCDQPAPRPPDRLSPGQAKVVAGLESIPC